MPSFSGKKNQNDRIRTEGGAAILKNLESGNLKFRRSKPEGQLSRADDITDLSIVVARRLRKYSNHKVIHSTIVLVTH